MKSKLFVLLLFFVVLWLKNIRFNAQENSKMCGPYPRLHRLSFPMSSMTESMLETLRHHIERHPNEAAAIRALTWLENTFPALEPACNEMRESFLSKDSETLKWSSSFAFNAIIIELSLSQQTLATSQRQELQYA
jgi:hypothetical protein